MGEDEMPYQIPTRPRITVKPADLRSNIVSAWKFSISRKSYEQMSEDERNYEENRKKRRKKEMRKLEHKQMQKKLQQMRKTGRNQ